MQSKLGLSMADLVRSSYINDWSLEAVIRGWEGGGGVTAVEEVAVAVAWQPPLVGLDEFEATATVLNELEALYKPFLLHREQPVDTCDEEGPALTIADSCSGGGGGGGGVEKAEEQEVTTPEVAESHTPARSTSSKRRRCMKKKQKTSVVHVGVGGDEEEENASKMDQWNWRKYGQKSIKGSPYPRSYYKCSSLLGCTARKQVEQRPEHPYALIVSYIGDHLHPVPTKRRSLAGRTLADHVPLSTSSS